MEPHRNPAAVATDESKLLERIFAGDEAAYELLVRIHGPQMLAVARRFLPEDGDARDTVEVALTRACRSISEFTGKCRLSTWLHRLTVDAALTTLRERRRHPEPLVEGPPSGTRGLAAADGGGEWQMSTAEAMARSEIRAQVRASIDRLPEADRTLLLLRDVERMSLKDIGDLLEISTSTVKRHLHRGRNALRLMLDPVMRRTTP